jgi:hypothetical protein
MLLARIYEVFPLLCPQCGAELRIIAFVTETLSVSLILEYHCCPVNTLLKTKS